MKRRVSLRKAVGGLDYTRCIEYPAVLDRLQLEAAARVLEVGASKLFLAPYIAVRHGVEVHATDQDPVVSLQRKWLSALGRRDLLESGRFVVARQDATALTYADEYFDRVVCVSTIEHIEAVERAAREIARVLRPGGIAGLTVPFSNRFRKVYVNHGVYGRPYDGTPQFYEYVFDRASLDDRVIQPSGLELRSLTFFGEPGLKMSRFAYTPGIGHALSLIRWAWPWTAHWFLKPVREEAIMDGTVSIAVLVLGKSSGPGSHPPPSDAQA